MLFFRSLMVGNRNLVRDLIGIVLALAAGISGQLILSDPLRFLVLPSELPMLSPEDWPGSQFFGPLRIEGGRRWSEQRAFHQSIVLIKNGIEVAEASQTIVWYANPMQAGAEWKQHKGKPYYDLPIIATSTDKNKPESVLLCSTFEPDFSPLCSYRAYWEHWYTEVYFDGRTDEDLTLAQVQTLTERIDQLLMSAPDRLCQVFFCTGIDESGNAAPYAISPSTALASTSMPTPAIDPTKIALEIEATAMRNFLTQQAATWWPSTQTPPPTRSPDSITPGVIQWQETVAIPIPSAAPLHPPQGLPLIFHNGLVYLFGGRGENDEELTNVYFSAIKPDGSLAGWKAMTSLPGKYVEHVEVVIGNYVYMLTGAAGAEDVYYAALNADGSVGPWKRTASLSPSRQTFAAVSHGNFIYAAGGNSGGTQDFVQYTSVKLDGSLNSWAHTTPLPVPIQEHTMIAYDGYLYIFGGKMGNDELATTVYFSAINPDGTLAGWNTTTPLPQQMYGYGTFEANGYVYLLGGDSSYHTRILEEHTLDAWQKANSLPAMRQSLRVGAYNGYAYAMGGYDLTEYQSTVYYGWIGLP